MNTAEKAQSEEQAASQMDYIRKMVEALHTENEDEREKLRISIRGKWHVPSEKAADTEYIILLCVGDPAIRITGDLNQHSEPVTAHLEHQDWGTWTEYRAADEAVLLEYARQFYFGE